MRHFTQSMLDFSLAASSMAAPRFVCPKYDEGFVLRCGYSDQSFAAACAASAVRCDEVTRQQFHDKIFVCPDDNAGGQRTCGYSPFSLEHACGAVRRPCTALPRLPS